MFLSRLFALFASFFASSKRFTKRTSHTTPAANWSSETLETRVMLSASGITIDGDFSDWANVTSYTDPADDQHDTDHDQQSDTPSYVDHPDVDLLEYKVTHDEENFYFYFKATGEIGATQQENLSQGLRAGRYYVIVTIDIDNDDSTGYWLHEGGYFPTTDGYDMNAELEFYNGSINTGHYLLHAALNNTELEQDFADQSNDGYVWGGSQTQGPFDPGFVELKSGDYDHYTQWVYKNNDPANGGNDSVTFVQDKGPVVPGIIQFAQSVDGTELEMIAPFKGFLVDEFDNPIVQLGQTVDISFSLEASGELSNEVSPSKPNGEWASDTGNPINGYVLTTPKDYGDAPDSYSTLAASGGASHLSSSLYLGTGVDTELDGQPGSMATLDTLDDGVASISALTVGQNVAGTFTSSGSGFLNAWMDYNQDGDFNDPGEQFFTDEAVVAGSNNLNFTIPATALTGQTYARLRLSSQSGLSYNGAAPDGEVEDYYVTIGAADADLSITKSSTPESVAQGEAVSYTVTVTNNGPDNVTGATVTDTFSDQLENVTWTAVLSGGASGNTSGSSDINELVDLPNGATVTYTVSGNVKSNAKLFVMNKASVTAPATVTDSDLTNNSDYDIDVITVTTITSPGEFVEGNIAPGVNDGDFVKEVAFGDLDGDGDEDAVFAFVDGGHQIWFFDQNAGILVNSGQALAIEPDPLGAHHALGTEIADFNNDGHLDILVLVKSTQAVYLNDGSGNFSEPGIDITGISSLEAYEVELGDLDGDGDIDAIVADDDGSHFGGSGNSLLLFNDGTGHFPVITSMPTVTSDDDTWDTTVGDFNGDGSIDIVFANFSSGQVSELWFNDGAGNFTKDSQNFGGKRHWNVEKGDFDNDGDLDLMLVVNNGNPDYVELWNNDGAGNFTYSGQRTFTNENGQGGVEGIQIGDLDGDGDLDAFFSTFGVVGTIQTWKNDGTGTFSTGFVSTFITPTPPDTAGGWRSRLGDVDGDGDLDAFVFEGFNEQVHYFENINNPPPYSEDFEDDVADGLAFVTPSRWGIYTDSGDKSLIFNGRDSIGLGAAYLDTAAPMPDQYEIVAKVSSYSTPNVWYDGFLIFDYQGPNDFKYAGMFVGQNQWVIGHYQGNWSNRIAQYDMDDIGGSINADQEYTLFVRIDGDDVEFFADGIKRVSGTFTSGIQNGTAGVASYNGWTGFDDLEIAPSVSYGKPVDIPFAEDFNDNVADDFYYNRPNYWKVVNPGGQQLLRVNTSYNDLLAVAHVPLNPETTPTDYSISADIRSIPTVSGLENGFIIFDYKHDNDFKYAGFFANENEWIIGHYQGDWNNRLAQVDWDDTSRTINTRQWYTLNVLIQDDIVQLRVDDELITQADFNVPLNQGAAGLASDTAFNWFDNFSIVIPPPLPSPLAAPGDLLFTNWNEESDELLI
ncbi:MAG: VCBS repeat-containing protein [Planctomycetaceae bacterium]|nr:VCBS repeat-containing protein [Planctomycetaceae bacterium]